MSKRTGWFDEFTKPVRPGVYETHWLGPGYSYWNGHHWANEHRSVEMADAMRSTELAAQNKEWRGLAKKP